jgi:hypothetical protein
MEVKTNPRTLQIVKFEVQTTERLIRARMAWINNPTNRMRGTYQPVCADTRKLEQKLAELKNEMQTLLKQ